MTLYPATPLIPQWFNLENKILWFIVSKALLKSKYTPKTIYFSLIAFVILTTRYINARFVEW